MKIWAMIKQRKYGGESARIEFEGDKDVITHFMELIEEEVKKLDWLLE